MKEEIKKFTIFALIAAMFFIVGSCSKKSKGDLTNIRGLADTVGFSMTKKQIETVVKRAEKVEGDSLIAEKLLLKDPWIAGICPHDDHVYAGRVYVHLLHNIKAKRVVIFGVGHKAWKWGVRDKIIFDNFDYWRGPYKPVPIMRELRKQIISKLDTSFYLVSNKYQSQEHSIEGIVPFLQYYNRKTEILPIIIPYMNWTRMDSIANALSEIISDIVKNNKWKIGKDIAFIMSTDCVHYGDDGWGGKNYAPFGVDEKGFKAAVDRDYYLCRNFLEGKIDTSKTRKFLYTLVDKDLYTYKITWCGRFSVPFGLDFLYHLSADLNREPFSGKLLRYATSYDLGRLHIKLDKPGITAPRSLRHWVGYCAVGYK